MNAAVFVFLAAVAGVAYVLLIYPVGLALYARLRSRPVHKQSITDREVTFVIPVRNGAQWVARKLQSIQALDYPLHLIQVFILSDGSSDDTNSIVQRYTGPLRVRLFQLPPQGKALTLNHGLQHVTTEFILLTDVRQEFDRDALRRLMSCFADPKVGVVTGELVIRAGLNSEEVNTGLYWNYEKWIRRNLNRIDAMLGATGAIYAIRRHLVRQMPAGTLLDDVYMPMAAALAGNRIYFECDAKAYDFPTSLQSEFQRKVRTQAGVYQIIGQFPSLLWPGNRRFIHFLSHKVGRLALPFLLILIALSSFFLPWPFVAFAVALQTTFYGAAALDPWIPEGGPIKRFSAAIRAFVVLIAAAMGATSVFFRPAQALWKDTKVSPTPSN